MTETRAVFYSRTSELRQVVRFLSTAERVTRADARKIGLTPTCAECLKASALIMIYNLVEAVVTTSLRELWERVDQESVNYANLSDELKLFWRLQRAKDIRNAGNTKTAEVLDEAITSALFNTGLKAFSSESLRQSYLGNLDGKTIRSTFGSIGVQFRTKAVSRDGSDLQVIRLKRNHLGHGIFSFGEVGRELSTRQIRENSVRARSFLHSALFAFEGMLARGDYKLARPQASPPPARDGSPAALSPSVPVP